jgi:hypothetical protein
VPEECASDIHHEPAKNTSIEEPGQIEIT